MSETTNEYGVSQQQLQRYADGFNNSEILTFFDMRVEFPDTSKVWAIVEDVKAGHRGGLGTATAINGGVLAALYDLVVGCSAALVDPRRRSATIQLSMNFEKPVVGDYVRGEAWVDRAGSKMVFASARIVDEHGDVCSHGQGVVRMSQKPWRGASPGG